MAESNKTQADETKTTASANKSPEAATKAADSEPKKDKIEVALDKKIQDKFEERLVEEAVNMRMVEHRIGEGSVDTDNPYGIKQGERVSYIVGGQAVYPNGKPVKTSTPADDAAVSEADGEE